MRSQNQAQPLNHIGTRCGIRFSSRAPAELISYYHHYDEVTGSGSAFGSHRYAPRDQVQPPSASGADILLPPWRRGRGIRLSLRTTSVRAAGSGSAPERQRSWYLTITITTRSWDQAQPSNYISTRRRIRFSPQAPAELTSYCLRR
jgi:hypothetical protein